MSKTIADMVAERFEDDGAMLQDANGSRIEDVCERAGGLRRTPKEGVTKFVFADGSALVVVTDEAWDWALDPLDDDCDCMVSEGPDHLLPCQERRI